MMRLKGSSGKNPLVQRVQRYTTMSAIFRSPDTTAVHQAQPGGETTDPVVNTFVIPPYALAELPPMAASTAAVPPQESGMEPTAATASAANASAATTNAAVSSQKEAFRASSPAPAGQPAALQRTAVFTPTAISKPSPDNWWSRLKSVTRRLQNVVTGGPEHDESALSPATPTPAPASPEIRPDVEMITAVSPAPTPFIQQETVTPLISQTPPLALIPIQDDVDEVSVSQSASSTPAVPLPFTAAAVPPSPANLPAAQRNIPAPTPTAPEADPTTRRLDQIMRLHREKGTIETPPKPETAQPETTQPETAVSSSPTLPPAIQREALTPAPPPGKTPTGELPAASADPISRRLDQIMRQHRQKGTIETPPDMTAPALQKEESTRNEPSTSQPAAAIEIEEDVRDSETAVSATSDSPTFSTPPAETQTIPLQSVWPVQVMAAPPPASRPSPAHGAPLRPQTTPQETSKAIRQLDSVPPGQPTTSSVQFIQPRKPRPQPLQRKPAPEYSQTDAKAAAPPSDFSTPSDTVATEIGDLPGDLWRLIGAKPPTMPTARSPEQPPPLPRFPAAPEGTESGAGQTTAVIQAKTTPPAIIQRIESEQTSAADLAPTTEAPPSAESEQDEAGQNEEIDINELARQVYGEIKDRMTIEWERTRGRF